MDPSNNLVVGYGLLPELCSDSAGGCYITYEQNSTYPRHLILERLNRYGYKPWGSGKQILGVLPEQSHAKITEDGQGGVMISYLDVEVTGGPESSVVTTRLRIQRVDSSGNFLWGINAVRASLAETDQADQAIVADGQGGGIVAWQDSGGQLRAQKLDNMGQMSWGDSGVFAARNTQQQILTAADTRSGIFVSWITSVSFVYKLQRISNSGVLLWDTSGVNLPVGATTLVWDGDYGVVMSGFDGSISNVTYVAQRIDSSGLLRWQRPYLSLADTTQSSFTGYPILRDECGSFVFVWPIKSGDLRAQIVHSDGSIGFPYGGRAISRIASNKSIIGTVASDSATSVCLWFDQRASRGIYAQRLDTLGRQLWDTLDVLVSIPELSYSQVVTDGSGGLITVGTRENFTIRAQQVSAQGNLGEVLLEAADHPATGVPKQIDLFQNYPNPFNGSTNISYEIPVSMWVRLDIYDVLGQELRTITNKSHPPGKYSIQFEGGDLPSGVYFYVLRSGNTSLHQKFIIMK